MVKDYYDVRAVFKKTGRAIFISHLDVMRLMQRIAVITNIIQVSKV